MIHNENMDCISEKTRLKMFGKTVFSYQSGNNLKQI